MKIIDEVIKAPTGGAHRNKEEIVLSTKETLIKYLDEFTKYTREEIFERRKEKFLNIGKQKTFTIFSTKGKWIEKDNFFVFIKKILFKFKKELTIGALLILVGIVFLI